MIVSNWIVRKRLGAHSLLYPRCKISCASFACFFAYSKKGVINFETSAFLGVAYESASILLEISILIINLVAQIWQLTYCQLLWRFWSPSNPQFTCFLACSIFWWQLTFPFFFRLAHYVIWPSTWDGLLYMVLCSRIKCFANLWFYTFLTY